MSRLSRLRAAIYIAPVLGMYAVISACGKGKEPYRSVLAGDRLTHVGRVEPSSSEPSGFISLGSLTDSGELLRRLEKIVQIVPPEDYSVQNHLELRRRAFASYRLKSVGDHNSQYLMTITCNSDSTIFKYNLDDRNIYIELYTDTPSSQNVIDSVKHYLESKTAAYFALIKLRILGVDVDELSEEDSEPYQQALSPIAERGATIKLATGVTISDQSPISVAALDVDSALSKSRLAMSEFSLAETTGRTGEIGPVTKPLQILSSKIFSWPYSYLSRPFWINQIPYSGDPKKLCLIGQFRNVDLVHGGDLNVPFVSPDAQLVGDLTAWYIIDRANGKIIHYQDAPVEKTTE